MTFARPAFGPTGHRLAVVAGASLAAALLAGCSGVHGVRSASAGLPDMPADKAIAKAEKAVARAELAVQKSPDEAAPRAALGNAYLAAGRFVSAATALDDAMALGDTSGRTALSLALAKIGSGQHREAVAILDDWRAEIPASDLGLALALAGETSRGVAVLADAVRGGDVSPKLRQNLAYAYALDGRWAEAKLMAAQDVPADQIDKRLAYWALSMLPDRNVERVAALIGAPARNTDAGQPAALALRAAPQKDQLAVQEVAPAAAAPAAALAPAAAPSTVETNIAVQTTAPAAPAPVRRTVASAFAAPAAVPVAAPARPARIVAAAVTQRPRALHVATTVRPVAGGHYVQLGAFSSQQGARRAWGFYSHRNPGLAAYRMTITPATVNGKQVWRVAAGGLTGKLAANTLCSRLKSAGGACFAYAVPLRSLPPGKAAPLPAAPGLPASGPQRARR